MNDQKLKGLIGLAVRARQAVLGMDACRILINSGKCGVLLIDEGAGLSTRKKAEALCIKSGTPMKTLTAGFIEEATGKSNTVIGLYKKVFSDEILMTEY